MAAQFLYFKLEPGAFEKGCYFRSQSDRAALLVRPIPQNVANLLFHASAGNRFFGATEHGASSSNGTIYQFKP
jgi:uncharacterized repeat protein (TIGR03803 family)